MQRSHYLPVLLVLLAVGAVYAATAGLPFFSETYLHTWGARSIAGLGDLLDPQRLPLRPFQHAWFWTLQALWPVEPALVRLPAFAAHLASAGLVYVLARRLGAERGSAACAALGFALFPNVKSLVYVAAVGWPFRVLATLVGLNALLEHAERPRWRMGALVLASFLFALACNEGAVVFPALGALLLLARSRTSPMKLARDPWLLACTAIAVLYALYVGLWQQRPAHNPVEPGALLANGARASLCLAPEHLRAQLIGDLRGGGLRQLLGLAAMAALAVGVVLWFRRASPTVRALLLCLPIEWAPAMAVTGFAQRYAYLTSALLVIALALTWDRFKGRLRVFTAVTAALLALGWTVDTFVDVRELRAAGRAVDSVLDAATRARARASPGQIITLLDPPQQMGSENDLLVLDYGLTEALALRGVEGPWDIVVTVGPSWRPTVVREPREAILDRLRRSFRPYVSFDPRTGAVQEER